MSAQIFSKVPEIIAGLLFLPCGLLFGYNLFLLSAAYYGFELCLPHLVAALSALFLAFMIRFVKSHRLIFYHFYYLFISSVFLVIGGCLIFAGPQLHPTVLAGTLVGSVSIGVTFVSGLNYIYIRSIPQNRSFNLSLCHLWFLIGIGLTFTIAAINDLPFMSQKNNCVGGMIVGSSIFIALLMMVNEVLNTEKGNDYRSSLDVDVNRENEMNQIFSHKHFHITSTQQDSGTIMWASKSWNPSKQLFSSMGLVVVKLRGLFVYYFPFFLLNVTFGYLNFRTETWISYWFPVIGAFIGTILLRFISARLLFLISSVLQIIFLIILTLTIELASYSPFTASHIALCFLLITFGLGYATNDILILDSVSLENSEVFIGFGVLIEMGAMAILQFINYSNNIDALIDLNPYSVSIIVFTGCSVFVAIFLVPNNFQKSILEIRNTMNGFTGNNLNPYPTQKHQNYNNENVQQWEQPQLPRVSTVPKFVPINQDQQCTCTCKCQSNVYPRIPKVDYI